MREMPNCLLGHSFITPCKYPNLSTKEYTVLCLVSEEPYVLIMEFVSYGTLRSFLQTERHRLSTDPELQSLLTIASYHIALAMEHICSKMVGCILYPCKQLQLLCWDTNI